MNKPLFEMKNISKSFPGVKALNDVSFCIRPGEVHALLGENGAGKSTLMNIILGYYQPDGGAMLWQGEQVKNTTPLSANQAGITMVHQESALFPLLDVKSNIFMGRYPKKNGVIDKKLMADETERLLDELEIKDVNPETLAQSMSSAKRKLVEIAKATAFDVKLLLLDEPTAPLTDKETEVLFKIIRKLKSRGISIIYTSHRLEEVFEIADSLTILRDGTYVTGGKVSDFTIDDVIKNMVGRTLDEATANLRKNVRKLDSNAEVVASIKNLCKKGDFQNISFDLRKGEILGVAGLVGAGRSELLKAIFGYEPADSGDILIKNKLIKMKSPNDAIKHKLAMIPEERHTDGCFLTLDVVLNICIASLPNYRKHLVLSSRSMEKTAKDWVDRLSIKTSSLHKKVGELSGGNQQKCVFSRSLLTNPEIILMDEPTHGIDVGAKADIYRIIRDLADQGISVIFVSSELNELILMCDRILVMHEGSIGGVLDRDEFSDQRIMEFASGIA